MLPRGHRSVGSKTENTFLLVILLMFGCIKMIHLFQRYNPNVSQLLMKNYYTEADKFNVQEEKWRIAFAFEDYLTSKNKIDPRYVKFFVRATGKLEGEEVVRAIPFGKCTESDLAEFLPVEPSSAPLLEKLTTDPERGLYCIDWEKADLNLHGNENKKNYQILEIMVLPCNMRQTHIGDTEDHIPDECIAELDAQMKFLGPLNLIFYYN